MPTLPLKKLLSIKLGEDSSPLRKLYSARCGNLLVTTGRHNAVSIGTDSSKPLYAIGQCGIVRTTKMIGRRLGSDSGRSLYSIGCCREIECSCTKFWRVTASGFGSPCDSYFNGTSHAVCTQIAGPSCLCPSELGVSSANLPCGPPATTGNYFNFQAGSDNVWHLSYFLKGGAIDSIVYSMPGTNETQRIVTTGVVTGGTFTLSYVIDGFTITTSAIPFNATAAQVASAFGSGIVSTTGGPLPNAVDITFINSYGRRAIALMTADTFLLTGISPGVSVTTITDGVTNPAINCNGSNTFTFSHEVGVVCCTYPSSVLVEAM